MNCEYKRVCDIFIKKTKQTDHPELKHTHASNTNLSVNITLVAPNNQQITKALTEHSTIRIKGYIYTNTHPDSIRIYLSFTNGVIWTEVDAIERKWYLPESAGLYKSACAWTYDTWDPRSLRTMIPGNLTPWLILYAVDKNSNTHEYFCANVKTTDDGLEFEQTKRIQPNTKVGIPAGIPAGILDKNNKLSIMDTSADSIIDIATATTTATTTATKTNKKHVSFAKTTHILQIPSRKYMSNDNKREMWYNKTEIKSFANDALEARKNS